MSASGQQTMLYKKTTVRYTALGFSYHSYTVTALNTISTSIIIAARNSIQPPLSDISSALRTRVPKRTNISQYTVAYMPKYIITVYASGTTGAESLYMLSE